MRPYIDFAAYGLGYAPSIPQVRKSSYSDGKAYRARFEYSKFALFFLCVLGVSVVQFSPYNNTL